MTAQETGLVTLLTSPDAARRLGISPRQLGRLVTRGGLLPAAQTASGHLLFDPAEVEAVRRHRKTNPPRCGRPKTKQRRESGA